MAPISLNRAELHFSPQCLQIVGIKKRLEVLNTSEIVIWIFDNSLAEFCGL